LEYTKDIEDTLRKLPNVQTVFTSIQPQNANYFVGMNPLEERKVSQLEMMRQTRAMLVSRYRAPGVRVNVSGGTDLSGASSAGGGGNYQGGGGNYNQGNRLNMSLQGPDIELLQTYVGQLLEKIKSIPGVVDIASNYEATNQELRVIVDRVRAADLG